MTLSPRDALYQTVMAGQASGQLAQTNPFQSLQQAQADRSNQLSQLSTLAAMRARVGQEAGIENYQNEVERDAATMSMSQLYAKYGNQAEQIFASQNQARQEMNQIRGMERSGLDFLGDTIGDAYSGVVGLTGNLMAAGHSLLVDPIFGTDLGQEWARSTKGLQDWMGSRQSDALQNRRELTNLNSQLLKEENAILEQREVADGSNATISALRRGGRDFIDGWAGSFADPSVMISDVVESGVSMFAAGPMGKGISALGSRVGSVAGRAGLSVQGMLAQGGKAAVAAQAVGRAAPTALAIGSMEASSAYSDAVNQTLERSIEDLERNSPEYANLIAQGMTPEEARMELADNAGQSALVTQGIIATLSGSLVSRLESGNLIRNFAEHGIVRSVGREGLEEAIQSGGGSFAVNQGIQQYVDRNQRLDQDVGFAAGQGAALGMISAGAIAVPGSAVRNSPRVIAATATGAMNVTKAISGLSQRAIAAVNVKAAKEAVTSLAADARDNMRNMFQGSESVSEPETQNQRKQKDVDPERINGIFDNLLSNAQEISGQLVEYGDRLLNSEDGTSEEREANRNNLINSVGQIAMRLNIDPEIVFNPETDQNIQANLQEADFENTNTFIGALARIGNDTNVDNTTRVDAVIKMVEMLNENSTLIGSLEQTVDQLPPRRNNQDRRFLQSIFQVSAALNGIQRTPAVRQALSWIQSQTEALNESVEAVQDEELSAADVYKMDLAATMSPDEIYPDTARRILAHMDRTGVPENDPQRRNVQSAFSLSQALTGYSARRQEIKPSEKAQQNLAGVAELIRNDSGGKNTTGPSLREHYKNIVGSMRFGDVELAQKAMDGLYVFARGLQTKVHALNANLERGDGTRAKATKYENFSNGKWVPSFTGLTINPTNAGSVAFAQNVSNDAYLVGSIYNQIATNYPELGFKPMDLAELNPDLSDAVADVVERFQNIDRDEYQRILRSPAVTPTQEVAQEVTQESAPEQVQETVQEATQEPVVEDTPVVKETTEQAPETVSETTSEVVSEEVAEPVAKPEVVTQIGNPEPVQEVETVETKEAGLPENIRPVGFVALVSNAIGSIAEYLTPNKESGNRLAGNPNPIEFMKYAMDSMDNNTDAKYVRYQDVLRDAGYLADKMVQRINDQLDIVVNRKKGGTKTIREYLSTGEDPLNQRGQPYKILNTKNNRLLHLVNRDADGNLVPNRALIEAAAMAALEFTMSQENAYSKLKIKDASKILAKPIYAIKNTELQFLRNGFGVQVAIPNLSRMILDYWDVSPNSSQDPSHALGIAQSTAASLISDLIDLGGITRDEMIFDVPDMNMKGATRKHKIVMLKSNYMTRKDGQINDALRGNASFITDTMQIPAADRKTYYVGSPPTSVSTAQRRNPWVENTAFTNEALHRHNQVPYVLNTKLANFFSSISREDFISMFGYPDVSAIPMNAQHRASVDGVRMLIGNSWDAINEIRALVENALEGSKEIYFNHEAVKNNRIMSVGTYTPQSNKYVRAILSPVQQVVDLTDRNSEAGNAMGLAIAQAVGYKIHKFMPAVSIEKIYKVLDGPLAEVVTFLGSAEKLTAKQISRMKEVFAENGLDFDPTSFQAIYEYAQYKALEVAGDTEALSNFSTQLYVEADGVSNGAANAIMMLSGNGATSNFLDNASKVGVQIINNEMSLNEFNSTVDSKDLYQKASDKIMGFLGSLREQIKTMPAIHQNMEAVVNLLGNYHNDVKFQDQNAEDPEGDSQTPRESTERMLVFGRGIMKNPLTITLYGSGTAGIAGNIAKEITDSLYERMSSAAQRMASNKGMSLAEAMFGEQAEGSGRTAQEIYNEFLNTINPLLSDKVILFQNEIIKVKGGTPIMGNFNPEKFEFSGEQIDALTTNLEILFVNPMNEAIVETIGFDVITNLGRIRKLTQVQGEILSWVYKDLVSKKLAELGRGPFEYLTRAEELEIIKSMKKYSTVFNNSKMNISPYFGQINTNRVFGSDRRDQYSVHHNANGPTNPGVASIPMSVIGYGDAYMIQYLTNFQNEISSMLRVYDGVNFGLNDIHRGSELANKAAFEAMMNNPLKIVVDNFQEFLKTFHQGNDLDISNELIGSLSYTLFNDAKYLPGVLNSGLTLEAALMSVIEGASNDAIRIDAFHDTLRDVKMAVDQMAATSDPYINSGKYDLSELSPDEIQYFIADQTNQKTISAIRQNSKDIAEAVSELNNNRTIAKISNKITEDFPVDPGEAVVTADDANDISAGYSVLKAGDIRAENSFAELLVKWGVDVKSRGIVKLTVPKMRQLLEAKNISRDNKIIMKRALESLAIKGYELITGNTELVAEDLIRSGTKMSSGGRIRGLTDIANKRIYLFSGAPSVLVHELVHAATFEKVWDFYHNPSSLTPNETEAIRRISALAVQFMKSMARNVIGFMNQAEQERAQNLYNLIRNARTKEARAEALNEFMAWGLTDNVLNGVFSRTEVRNPLAQITQKIIDAVKKLFRGKNAISVTPGTDLLSNLQFNSMILMPSRKSKNETPSPRESVIDTVLKHDLSDISQGSERIRAAMKAAVTAYAVTGSGDRYQNKAKNGVLDGIQLGVIVANEIMAAGFDMTEGEADTFRAVVSALATSARLDGNALSEANKYFDLVIEKITPEHFLPENIDLEKVTQAEQQAAALKRDAILGRVSQYRDKNQRTTMLGTFIGLAAVSSEFQEALRRIDLPKADRLPNKNLDNVLSNIAEKGMETLQKASSGSLGSTAQLNANAAMQALIESLVQQAENKKNFLDQSAEKVAEIMGIGNGFIVNQAGKLNDGVYTWAKGYLDDPTKNNKHLNNAVSAIALVSSALSEERSGHLVQGAVSWMNKKDGLGSIFDKMAIDMIGRTEDNKGIYDLIKITRATIQKIRQQYRTELPQIFNNRFTRDVSAAEWTTMFIGLGKADIVALHKMNPKTMIGLLADLDGQVPQMITDAEAGIAQMVDSIDRHEDIIRQSKNLANFLKTGEAVSGLLRNAYAIAMGMNKDIGLNNVDPDMNLVRAIDELTTLYTLNQLEPADKASLKDLAENEADGLELVISYLTIQKKDELRSIHENRAAMFNHYKGYAPSQKKSGKELIVAPKNQKETLAKVGFTMLENFRSDTAEVPMAYYISDVSTSSMFNPGILQIVKQTVAGVDPSSGFTTDQSMYVVAERIVSLNDLPKGLENEDLLDSTYGYMPIFNEEGVIRGYELLVDAKHDQMLKRSTNLAESIGQWRGRQVEEVKGEAFNRQAMSKLKSNYDQGVRDGRADEYVNILDPNLKDPILKDARNLMNRQLIALAQSQFGKDQFMVRKDLIDDVMGYRSASVRDFWNGVSRWDKSTREGFRQVANTIFGDKAYERLVKAEEILQNFVADARVVIVVKSVVVPMANLAANFLQLKSRGIPLNQIIKGFPKKSAELKLYTDTRWKEVETEVSLRAALAINDQAKARTLEVKLKNIREGYKRLSIWPLIEAGEFTSINDIAMTREEMMLTEGRLNDYIEQKVNQLPESVKNFGRYAFITKDTSLFQGLQRSVEYGDFLGKAIFYDHLVHNQGMDSKQALGAVTEEFVNYDRLPGRARGALEANGLMWFWNFKLRSVKIGINMVWNNPLFLLMGLGAPLALGMGIPGSPVSDNLLSLLTDPFRVLFSLGPDQAFNAHFLNPWYNLAV